MKPSTIDFERGARSHLAGRIVLAVGLAAAAWVGWQHHARAEASAERTAAVAARAAARQRAAEAARKPAVPTLEERQQHGARALLNQPWLPVLRAIEGATLEPLYVLSLSLDGSTGRLQIEGIAPGFKEAVSYVDNLAADPLIEAPRLLSHEAVPTTTGGMDVRFHLSAGWNAK
jgi:Fimbrial assembly protein (PilN)